MKKIISIYLLFCACTANANVAPSIVLPPDFSSEKFVVKNLDDTIGATYTQQSFDCNSVKFKEYYFLAKLDSSEYFFKKSPATDWECVRLNSDEDSYGLGYDPSVADEKPSNEFVRYDEKNNVWKIVARKKYHKNDIPLQLYNIVSPNAKGYIVIDSNVNKYDIQKGVSKKIGFNFCMIESNGKGYALCGQGNLLKDIDGKEADLTPYFIKSLESMTLSNK